MVTNPVPKDFTLETLTEDFSSNNNHDHLTI